jgi:hypothetical protein
LFSLNELKKKIYLYHFILQISSASRESGKEVARSNAQVSDQNGCPTKGGGGATATGGDAREEGKIIYLSFLNIF